MRSAKTLIRLYEAEHGANPNVPRIGIGTQTTVRLYGYVRKLKDGEAQFEAWIAANSRRKGHPLMMKCVYKFKTREPLKDKTRDLIWYSNFSQMVHDHICYDFSENGGPTRDYVSCVHGMERGKWYSRTAKGVVGYDYCDVPRPYVMLNGWEETKYKYWGYTPDSGVTVMEYLQLYNITPKVELLSKARLFRLLTPQICSFLNSNKRFGKFLAKHLDEAKDWTPYKAMRLYAKLDPVCAETVRKAKRDEAERKRAALAEAERKRKAKAHREFLRKHREDNKRIAALYEQIYTACRVYGAYEVVCPQTVEEMLAEGEAMHNCIGHNYAPRQGKEDICLFLRKDGKPFVDFRIDAETYKVQECRLVCNKDAGKAEWKIARETARLVQAVRERKDGAKRKTA